MKHARDLFDEYAAAYDEALSNAIAPSGESREYFAQGRVAWLKHCLNGTNFAPQTVLDFGCGDGATTPLLRRQLNAKGAIGIDVSTKSLDIAQRKYASEEIHYESFADFTPCGQIDIAYCNGVFHHIPPARRMEALTVVHQALRESGVFSFWENNPWSLATRYVMSRCAFDRDAIMLSPPEARRLLRQAGFETLRTDFRFIFPRALRSLRKVEDYICRVPVGAQYQVLCRKLPGEHLT